MTMNAATVLARARPRVRPHCIAKQLQRYAWRYRSAVSGLAAHDRRLGDLAISFPSLLFALAIPRRGFDPSPAIGRAIAGASLRELAECAAIPLWTRHLPPETFQRPLPALPDSELFRRQIANHWPRDRRTASAWLKTVADAASWGHEGLAVWLARHFEKPSGREARRCLPLLWLWAWHSTNPAASAFEFLATKWSPELSPERAILAARDWKDSVLAALEIGGGRITDAWAEPATVDGYQFEPIPTAMDLIAAAREFNNCARNYGSSVAAGATRFWLVKRDQKTVAMLNLGAASVPVLEQVSELGRSDASPELSLAIHRWLRGHCLLRILPKPTYPEIPRRRWARMWRAYWIAKQRIPTWLPLAPPESLYRWLEPGFRRRRRRRR